jgi:hypothetical protein
MKRCAWLMLCWACVGNGAWAELVPKPGLVDPRVRVVAYDPDQVIRLRGYVGYQIHFQFAEGETLVSLAAGDNKALDVGVEANHMTLKPQGISVRLQRHRGATGPGAGRRHLFTALYLPAGRGQAIGRGARAAKHSAAVGLDPGAAPAQCELLGLWVERHSPGERV